MGEGTQSRTYDWNYTGFTGKQTGTSEIGIRMVSCTERVKKSEICLDTVAGVDIKNMRYISYGKCSRIF